MAIDYTTHFKKGDVLHIVGPVHFPIDFHCIVVQGSKYEPKTDVFRLYREVRLRIAEYHGRQRLLLCVPVTDGAPFSLTDSEHTMDIPVEVFKS